MSKKPKSLKRKSSTSDEKSKKKSKFSDETALLPKKELMKITGLSSFMLGVAIDLLDKSGESLELIDIVYPNEDIRTLNKEVIDAFREESASSDETKPKKKKIYTDDEVRKLIVEKREKALASAGVRLAGSTQYEKMDHKDKDMTLVSEFLGYAHTSHDYYVYVYYVGPDTNRSVELRNPRNWIPVNKTHLLHFHRRLRNKKSYHTHTSNDQASFKKSGALNEMPSYDPRSMMHEWLTKDGKVHKPLLLKHKSAFGEKDFLIKHYEEKEVEGALHYYDETAPDRLVIDLSMDVEGEKGSIFNAEADRLRQQMNGYRYNDKEICHVTIEEFPPLSRIPLPQEIDLTCEEFIGIAQHVHVSERNPRPPESYVCDPFVMTKAAMMALNLEMQVKRLPSLLGDEKLQILEGDNMTPILDFMANHKSCTDTIKQATLRSLYAFMAVELMTREHPSHIQELLDKEENQLVLLDS